MRVVLDIEANGLLATVSNVWCVVCKDIDTNEVHVFKGEDLSSRFKVFAKDITEVIGHNVIQYDLPVLDRLLGWKYTGNTFDTLVVSRLLDVGREGGHSLENWGHILKHNKTECNDFSQLTDEMVEYCINDVELNHKVYKYEQKILTRNPGSFDKAISIEQDIQRICLDIHENGFTFNIQDARRIDDELSHLLSELDIKIQESFPPVVRRIQLKTKVKEVIEKFNPGSPKQIVDKLWEAGWEPVEKTKTHSKEKGKPSERSKKYGWKINETNLATLPESAPEGCRLLVEHILLSARRRTLAEWFSTYNEKTGRIHGQFNPLGARTHRCTHSSPNMGNIATKKTIKYNTPHLRELAVKYGGEMRALWTCPEGSWLVGTDMESAHLRIFAHLIDDKTFIQSLISGKKEDGTDPHSLNKRALGDLCVDRDRAKTFIFSFLNGAGASKVSEIFNCPFSDAQEVLGRFVRSYPGLQKLKEETIPRDARRGYFVGIDGRKVKCDSEHLMMGMYLQNMESLIMKYANVMWRKELEENKIRYSQVNWVHDEWVTEVPGDIDTARSVGIIQARSIKTVGEMFRLKCPMDGSHKVGKSWLDVH